MELAIEQSRREAFRNQRKEQDDEYERALREAQQQEQQQQQLPSQPQPNIQEQNLLFPEENNNISSNLVSSANESGLLSEDIGDGIGIEDDNDNDIYNIDNQIELDPLPSEVSLDDVEESECVSIRVRLPNGIRIERRFIKTSNIGSIILWVQHECVKHKQTHLINHSQLISTHPHTVYNDDNKTLQELGFWRPNAKRKIVSPLLYVEEL